MTEARADEKLEALLLLRLLEPADAVEVIEQFGEEVCFACRRRKDGGLCRCEDDE